MKRQKTGARADAASATIDFAAMPHIGRKERNVYYSIILFRHLQYGKRGAVEKVDNELFSDS